MTNRSDAAVENNDTGYYGVLGISQDATEQDIRSAYVRLIKETHPDVNKSSVSSTKRAQVIIEAYSVLKERSQREAYDRWLSDQNTQETSQNETPQSSSGSQEHRPSDRPAYTEAQPYRCENCGKQDVFLRCYVFAWVTSFIFQTRHGSAAFILCNTCRLKKSLLYLLWAATLGWWGFPWGIIYTLVAVVQNSFGGMLPAEINCSLLTSQGYMLFARGHYNEALECMIESQRLDPTGQKSEFIEHLKSLAKPVTAKQKLFRHLSRIGPSILLVPALALLIWAIVAASTNQDTGYHAQYMAQATNNSSATITSTTDQIASQANKAGFDLTKFKSTIDSSNTEVAQLASYIQANCPITGTHVDGTTTWTDYDLDRSKLSVDKIKAYMSRLRENLYSANNQASAVNVQNIGDANSHKQFHDYILTELDFMRACFFNASILYISISDYNSPDMPSQSSLSIEEVKGLENDQAMDDWISRLGQSANISNLLQRLSTERGSELLQLDITNEQADLKEETQWIHNDQTNLNALRSSDTDQYNNEVPYYNELVDRVRSENQQLNKNISQYNSAINSLNNNPVSRAFDACIDGKILLSSFDSVDLTSGSQPSETKQ